MNSKYFFISVALLFSSQQLYSMAVSESQNDSKPKYYELSKIKRQNLTLKEKGQINQKLKKTLKSENLNKIEATLAYFQELLKFVKGRDRKNLKRYISQLIIKKHEKELELETKYCPITESIFLQKELFETDLKTNSEANKKELSQEQVVSLVKQYLQLKEKKEKELIDQEETLAELEKDLINKQQELDKKAISFENVEYNLDLLGKEFDLEKLKQEVQSKLETSTDRADTQDIALNKSELNKSESKEQEQKTKQEDKVNCIIL